MLKELIEELLEMFDMDSEEWPVLTSYYQGEYHDVPISDELYELLTKMKEEIEND